MKELRDIARAYDKARTEGRQTALATVVLVEGSAYRRTGARMLVSDDGQLTGAISGGCLEGDALRKALMVMARQQPMLVTYDTTDDDDSRLGVGLGCNGIIHILIEPIDAASADNAVELIKKIIERQTTAALITLYSLNDKKASGQGTCVFLDNDEIRTNTASSATSNESMIADANAALQSRKSVTKSYGMLEVKYLGLIDIIEPSISLFIAGAGNDAIPVTQLAAVLGWKIVVADGRPNYATAGRFPLANKVIVSKPGQAFSEIAIDERTAVVLMTHNYNYDIEMVKQCLAQNVKYLGILGPKKKTEKMLDELAEEGLVPNEEQLKNIYGPVGLDVGAETAEEIALSIISEIKAVFSARSGTSLRDKKTPIHTGDTHSQSLTLQYGEG